jgi:hypothetical protein
MGDLKIRLTTLSESHGYRSRWPACSLKDFLIGLIMQPAAPHSLPYPKIESPLVKEHIQYCADECMQCARLCEESVSESMRIDVPGLTRSIELCRDCADVCLLTLKYLLRESPYIFEACHLCGKVCEACATACDEQSALQLDGDIFSRCADRCHRCANACKQLSIMTGNTMRDN